MVKLMEKDSLSRRALRGIRWKFQARFSMVLIQLVLSVILARLLSPQDFGLVALAMIIIGFAETFSSLGVGPAIIQLKELTEDYIRTGYSISVLLGLLTTATIWSAAPVFEKLLGSAEVLPIIRFTSLTFLFAGFGVIPRALLVRKLDFKKTFIADVMTAILAYGLVSIFLALNGFGVWSLVFGALTQTLTNSLILFIMAPHSLMPRLRVKECKRLVFFGGFVSINAVLNYCAARVDYFVIGRILSTNALGLYGIIMRFMSMPLRYFSGVLAEVLFPAFSEIQDERERLSRGYFLSVKITALVCFPFLIGVAIVAPEMIRGILGPKWVEATPALQILCFGFALKSITRLAGPITHATGNVPREAARQFIYFIILSVTAIIGTRWGIEGVAMGVNIGSLALFCMNGQLSLRIIGSNWKEFLINLRPGFALSIWVGIPLIAFREILKSLYILQVPDLLFLGGMALTGSILYVAGFFIIPVSWYGEGTGWITKMLGLRLPSGLESFLNQISKVVPTARFFSNPR